MKKVYLSTTSFFAFLNPTVDETRLIENLMAIMTDARFDNLVSTSLLKRLNYLEDSRGYRYELRYIRDKEGREVDFAVVKDGELEELIEVK